MSTSRGLAAPDRHEVWIVEIDPSVGHEQGGVRPALIISDSGFNSSRAGLVIVVPITGTTGRVPAHILVDPPEGGLIKPSYILTDQVRTISKLRLSRYLGVISPITRAQVEARLRIHLAL